METDFIRERITQLRLQHNVSEYKMSLDLGQSKGYIQGITSGKTLPSMTMFLEICHYFEISPEAFFAGSEANESLVAQVTARVRTLPSETVVLLLRWLDLLK